MTETINDKKIRVLLVDDQAMVGEAVKRMLESEQDIEYKYITDPTIALKTATEYSPTVILQDLVMPDIDGLTLVKFMRANPALRDIPLIVLSSKEEATTKAEAFELGANDYLVKLPDKIELIARIRHHSQGYINLLERNEAYDALSKSEKKLKKELDRAADYVISLLPKEIDDKGIKTAWRFIPSASLGGDSFGYIWLDEDNFAMFLLDVCDHGVGSALLSVSAMNVLTGQTLPNTDFKKPDQVLTALNNTFQMESQNNLYFTIWYGVYNKSTKELRYASGGHPPALLLNGSGEDKTVQELRTKNLFVGGMPDMEFSMDSCTVETPCRLYVYSDGIYEVKYKKENRMWDFSEFVDYIKSVDKTDNEELDEILAHVKVVQESDIFEDDVSIMEIFIN